MTSVRAAKLQEYYPYQKKLSKIVDVTIVYPEGKAIEFLDIMLGRRKDLTIYVHYRIFDVDEVPNQDKNEIKNWMYHLYYEKERLLEEFYRSGMFSSKNFTSRDNESIYAIRQIHHIKWKYFIYNIFYFFSFFMFVMVIFCFIRVISIIF